MEQKKFRELFRSALEETRRKAEEQIGIPLPQKLQIIFHGPPVPGAALEEDLVFKEIWLDEERFYRCIDLLVIGYSDTWTRLNLTVSGHTPSSFWDTWNPKEFGPFKPLGADLRLRKSGPPLKQ